MRTVLLILCALLGISSSLKASSSTFLDYQNYNHGYCPECNCYPCRCAQANGDPDLEVPPQAPESPCNTCAKPDPCDPAPVCATQCGVSLCCIGGVIALVAAAGAILIGINNGHSHS